MLIFCRASLKRKEGISKLPLFASLMTCHEIRPHPICYNGKPFAEYQRANGVHYLNLLSTLHATKALMIHLHPNLIVLVTLQKREGEIDFFYSLAEDCTGPCEN